MHAFFLCMHTIFNSPLMVMDNSSFAIIVLALVYGAALLAFTISKSIFFKRRNPPPGPKPWPIIGNLNLIGPIPHQSLHTLSQKYGDIMQLKFGKFPVVVASSPEMAEQFLKVHDSVFASRPALAAGKYTAHNYSDMIWAPYGPYWRRARKIYFSEVFNATTLESFEHVRTQKRRSFLSRLRSLSSAGNNVHVPVVMRDELMQYTLSHISMMVLSDKYSTKMDELKEMLEEWFFLNGAINIGDWIPCVDFLDLQGYVKRMKALRERLDRFLDYVIDDHQLATRRSSSPEKRDMLDMLLQQADDDQNPNPQVELTRDRVKGLLQDLLAGGTDTSVATIEWAICEILRKPRILKKAKEELDRVIGRERWVDENDYSRLPYIEAIIMETVRLHPLSTLLAPHHAIEDCKVAGFDISKGTTVLINTWTIGRDPRSWDAPQEFWPERFMGKETDMLGSNFALLPFGSGRRRCPGYKLGLKIVRTTLANLLHGFELKLVEGMRPEDISLEEQYGLTTHPKHPLAIILQPTLSDRLS